MLFSSLIINLKADLYCISEEILSLCVYCAKTFPRISLVHLHINQVHLHETRSNGTSVSSCAHLHQYQYNSRFISCFLFVQDQNTPEYTISKSPNCKFFSAVYFLFHITYRTFQNGTNYNCEALNIIERISATSGGITSIILN